MAGDKRRSHDDAPHVAPQQNRAVRAPSREVHAYDLRPQLRLQKARPVVRKMPKGVAHLEATLSCVSIALMSLALLA